MALRRMPKTRITTFCAVMPIQSQRKHRNLVVLRARLRAFRLSNGASADPRFENHVERDDKEDDAARSLQSREGDAERGKD